MRPFLPPVAMVHRCYPLHPSYLCMVHRCYPLHPSSRPVLWCTGAIPFTLPPARCYGAQVLSPSPFIPVHGAPVLYPSTLPLIHWYMALHSSPYILISVYGGSVPRVLKAVAPPVAMVLQTETLDPKRSTVSHWRCRGDKHAGEIEGGWERAHRSWSSSHLSARCILSCARPG